MRTSLFAIALAVNASVAFADGPAPVDPNLLHGQTLVSAEDNFSIDAPEGWSWFTATAGDNRSFACRRGSDGQAFIVLTHPDSRLRMHSDSVDNYATGMATTLRKQGARDVSFRHSPSDRLFPNGHQLDGSFVYPDGSKGRLHGYLGVRGRFYFVQTIFKEATTTPQDFEPFASSFRLVQPVSSIPALSVAFTMVALILIATTLWLAFFVCSWPPAFRRIELLLAIFALLFLLYMGAAWAATLTGRKSADDLDGVLGQVSGLTFAPCVATLIVTFVRRARRPQ